MTADLRTSSFELLSPPYGTLLVDPPWDYETSQRLSGRRRRAAAARRRYSTLSARELAALPVGDLAADAAHLWLWVTNARLAAGDHVGLVEAWGFRPITVVTWCKTRPGLGTYLRNSTEHLVFAVRGWGTVPDIAESSTWHVWLSGAHSVKPAAAADLVERVSPGPYLELFARQQRLGWDSHGLGFESEGVR